MITARLPLLPPASLLARQILREHSKTQAGVQGQFANIHPRSTAPIDMTTSAMVASTVLLDASFLSLIG